VFDNAKVSDHFAIIPTLEAPSGLSDAEQKIYDLVTRRFMAVFFPSAEYMVTTRISTVLQSGASYCFKSEGKVLVKPGFLAIYGKEAASEVVDAKEGDKGQNLVPVQPDEVGAVFQPGFLQAERDDALFLFAQQRALMLVAGAAEYGSIKRDVPFELGVFRLPSPTPADPVYGPYVLGPKSEAGAVLRGAFALTKQSAHPEAAIDFLRFLTSRDIHTRFTRASGWLPVIRGVEPNPEIAAFTPAVEGYPGGEHPGIGMEGQRLWNNLIFELYRPDGIARVTAALERAYPATMIASIDKEARELPRAINHLERLLFAAWLEPAAFPDLAAKQSEAREAQLHLELSLAAYDLDRTHLRARRD
jgi:hypothetical protein